MRGLTLTALSLLLAFIATPAAAQDGDADAILRRCINRLQTIRERASTRNGETATRVVARIEELLEDGKQCEEF